MTKWNCIYMGKPDKFAAGGHAAPSWHTFDERVWKKGKDLTLILRNVTNDSREDGDRPPKKWIHEVTIQGKTQKRHSTFYRVTLYFPSDGSVYAWEGSNWQLLVTQAKQFGNQIH